MFIQGYYEPKQRLKEEVDEACLSPSDFITVDHGETWVEDPNARYHSISTISDSSESN